MFRQILHSYWPTRHDSASLHHPEPPSPAVFIPSPRSLCTHSLEQIGAGCGLHAVWDAQDDIPRAGFHSLSTISALHRIPPLFQNSVFPLNTTTTTALSLSQGDHGPVFRFVYALKCTHFFQEDGLFALTPSEHKGADTGMGPNKHMHTTHKHNYTLTLTPSHTHTHMNTLSLSCAHTHEHASTNTRLRCIPRWATSRKPSTTSRSPSPSPPKPPVPPSLRA
jgi:hypothetical protein